MKRIATRLMQHTTDLAVLSLALWLAFLLRFDWTYSWYWAKQAAILWPYVVGLQFVVLVAAGVTRLAWRYVSLRDARRITGAIAVSSALLLGLRIGVPNLTQIPHARYLMIPIGVICIDFALALLGIAGVRGLRRALAEWSDARRRRHDSAPRVATILIGAGRAGVMVAREIEERPDLGIAPVGFVDDDRLKVGTMIHGLSVLGTTADLARIRRKTSARQALIAIASARGADIRRIVGACEQAELPAKIIPGMYEILDGRVNLSRIRDVSIEDLLGRDPVSLDTELLVQFIRDKRVLVTGAGGSIGSELCRQIARLRPACLVLVERAEFHLFTIHHEMTGEFPNLDVRPRLCDVCDTKRLDAVFDLDAPHVVFHAAAHKHVPMMEWNPGEAIKNNVFGTMKVADAADRHGAEAFVLISTDKAVNPTSVMGATKRVAEMYLQALSSRTVTKLVAVRFGNVLGSAGSVIPTFKAQIAAGGPLTVTHPQMKRYFMTIPEASQLVLQAAAMGRGGEIYVLDMGEPVRIADLARDLIKLSGLEPDEDIRIEYTGIRPGEKLFEEIGFDAEKMEKTRHPKIFVGRLASVGPARMQEATDLLSALTGSNDVAAVRAGLRAVVPEMREPSADDEPEESGPRPRASSAPPDPSARKATPQPRAPGTRKAAARNASGDN
jgi:FlaA1/EpsC-like NDP-sugar epimerase